MRRSAGPERGRRSTERGRTRRREGRPSIHRREGRLRLGRRDALRAGAGVAAAVTLAGCAGLGGDDPAGYEPLGSVDIDDAAEAVVGDDDIVYVAATTGFATVDVSDPAEPTVRADVRGLLGDDRPPLLEVLDVDYDADRLAVPGPANPNEEVFNGFVLYDVSDPGDPVPATEPVETGFPIHNCLLRDGLLYVVANDEAANPLVIYDVTGDDVSEVGRWSLLDREPAWGDVHWELRYLHDVTVRDDVAVLPYWNAGTYLVDVSDPADPAYVTHVQDSGVTLEEQRERRGAAATADYVALPGNDHYAELGADGELLAVGRESWATEAGESEGAGGIDLYELADSRERADHTHLATIDAPPTADASYRGGAWTTAHNFELRDDRLFASWYQGGVTIHDLSDPGAPEELASWRDPETAGFWTARVLEADETFVASSTREIRRADTEGALYTFPIESGEQADQPSVG